MNDKCVICEQPFGDGEFEGISQYAAYGGLPSPCCDHCFSANDYSIKNLEQLKYRSWQRRVKHGGEVISKTNQEDWKVLEEACEAIGQQILKESSL